MSPRHQEIYQVIRAQIVDGKYRPGDELPPETALMEEWKVSRGPIRQALSNLRSEGLIYTTRGRPARVRRPHQPTQTLASFTPFSQWALPSGREPGNHTLSVSRRRADGEVADGLQLDEGAFIVEVVRLRTLDGVPALLERSRFTLDTGQSLFEFDADKGSITDHLVDVGVEFASMRHELDAIAADATDAEALQIPVAAPLLRERRTSFDPQGKPFEYSDDRYRPDQVTFSIMNTMTGEGQVSR
ncbi:GntR family transcriptional regulator [Gordonia sp. ABSL11-1]|uniref:GntR family transcriptional regulator n=1 Tax=Gordonia sp. ABSL11-1 TaxID=3053924 RepID=UPI002573F00A|nr:GntR family transcriptional regulator [Gordonia sp. ABSL11-1]MDL9947121.1 GntR family transcriptional regulator [Gordonia sp. ABSL11-1]